MSVCLSDYHKSVFYRKSWTNRDVFQENSDIVVQSCRDLGITTTHDLSFSEHINNMVFKAHQRANAILRCFVSRNITLLLRVLCHYVIMYMSGLF